MQRYTYVWRLNKILLKDTENSHLRLRESPPFFAVLNQFIMPMAAFQKINEQISNFTSCDANNFFLIVIFFKTHCVYKKYNLWKDNYSMQGRILIIKYLKMVTCSYDYVNLTC